MTLNAHDIRARADALLRDTQPLHTAAGLGFVADKKVVDEALASMSTYAIVDARFGTNDDVRGSIIAAFKQKKPIALCVSEKVPMSALLFAQAVADRLASVDLGDRTARPLPKDVAVVVLALGAQDPAALPRQLQRVDFWEFLP